MGAYGRFLACNTGQYWTTVVTTGHFKALAIIDDWSIFRGAGDGDRTRMASLEGWSSTIELHPRVSGETRSSLEH